MADKLVSDRSLYMLQPVVLLTVGIAHSNNVSLSKCCIPTYRHIGNVLKSVALTKIIVFMSLIAGYVQAGMIGDNWDYSCGRIPSIVIAEGALLVTLTSPDVTVSSMAAKGLREIAIAECLPNPRRTIEEPDDQAKRYPMYEQLGDPSVIVIGRVAQQRRIRKLLRMISGAFSLHGTVWYECYWRWAALKDWVTRPSSDIESDVKNKIKPDGDLGMTHEVSYLYRCLQEHYPTVFCRRNSSTGRT